MSYDEPVVVSERGFFHKACKVAGIFKMLHAVWIIVLFFGYFKRDPTKIGSIEKDSFSDYWNAYFNGTTWLVSYIIRLKKCTDLSTV